MERDKMIKRRWKAFEPITFKAPRMGEGVDCLLIAINFDDETMVLQPLGEQYNNDDFYANIKYCELTPLKMRKV